ncbi:MAG: hypothetical protein ACRDJH_07780 [Thermomicrobiales bacterium]
MLPGIACAAKESAHRFRAGRERSIRKGERNPMNLKYKALGLVAAIGMSLSVAAPAMAVDDFDATADVTVTLTEGGVFAVSISSASLDDQEVSALSEDVVSTGAVNILYTDTKSYRTGFFAQMYASDFSSTLLKPLSTTETYSIPASNLQITRNYDTLQGRCTCGGPRIGDIGPTSDGNDQDNSGGPYNDPGSPDPTFGRFHDWNSVPNNTLEDDGGRPYIAFGFDGPGTAGAFNPPGIEGSTQRLEIALNVPDGQPATTYTSTLTVLVTTPGP